ncbi:MAG: GntR family transcriptional regulator [Burkholderiales bacterium]|nr:GntR family transcriptional regulator [Burkholderiales bacterium]
MQTIELDSGSAETDDEHRAVSLPSSLAKVAEDYLETRIADGSLPPGTVLNPAQIASDLGISKSPVREALLLLQREGLVTRRPRSVFLVSEMNMKDLNEIYPLRASLNALAVRTILQQPSASAIVARLGGSLEAMRRSAELGDKTGFVRAVEGFYNLLISSCPNQRLQAIWRQLSRQIQRFRFLVILQTENLDQSLQEHLQLVAAMKEGFVDEAARRAEAIIYGALQDLHRILKSNKKAD